MMSFSNTYHTIAQEEISQRGTMRNRGLVWTALAMTVACATTLRWFAPSSSEAPRHTIVNAPQSLQRVGRHIGRPAPLRHELHRSSPPLDSGKRLHHESQVGGVASRNVPFGQAAGQGISSMFPSGLMALSALALVAAWGVVFRRLIGPRASWVNSTLAPRRVQLFAHGVPVGQPGVFDVFEGPMSATFIPFCDTDAQKIRFAVFALEKIIDSHLHIWSDGQAPYQWVVDPPPELQSTGTYETLIRSLESAGVSGALVVQPANHKYDHSYVLDAISKCPELLRGMCLANPTLPVPEAVAELERLAEQGFVAVRFNPALFPDGLDSPVGKALFEKAGELVLPVGIMCFSGFTAQAPAIEALMKSSPDTTVVIDHWGFFRQPATGGLLGDAGVNDEEAWEKLLALAQYPQVYVKVSALFRVSGEPWPHEDLKLRLQQLLKAFGSYRLMWGSDWPFVTIGGNTPTSMALEYRKAVQTLVMFQLQELGPEQMEDIMWRTAYHLFQFSECTDSCAIEW